MSKGLGERQKLFLRAVASLAAEHGRSPRGEAYLFSVAGIVRRAYALAGELQMREAGRVVWRKERRERLRSEALAGDERSMQIYKLDMIISSPGFRSRRGRNDERKAPNWVEEDLNPSRILASLVRRRFLRRCMPGRYGITDAGRAMIGRIGVGSS